MPLRCYHCVTPLVPVGAAVLIAGNPGSHYQRMQPQPYNTEAGSALCSGLMMLTVPTQHCCAAAHQATLAVERSRAAILQIRPVSAVKAHCHINCDVGAISRKQRAFTLTQRRSPQINQGAPPTAQCTLQADSTIINPATVAESALAAHQLQRRAAQSTSPSTNTT
jgi:hypothetical protein